MKEGDKVQLEKGGLRITFQKILKEISIKAGDRIRINEINDGGKFEGYVIATVVAVYERYVLLDMGKFKECRLIVDIYFDKKGIYKML